MRPVPPITTIFTILPSEGMQGVSGCVVFDAAKDAGSAAGKPCGGLEARLNFAWVSVQSSGTKEQDESAPLLPEFPLALPARQPARASALITMLSMACRPW